MHCCSSPDTTRGRQVTGATCTAVSGMVDKSPMRDCRSSDTGSDVFKELQGETNIDDPGCFATLQCSGGWGELPLTVTVCAGNSLAGAGGIRIYGTQGNAIVGGDGSVEVNFFGGKSSTGQILEGREEVWAADDSVRRWNSPALARNAALSAC